MQPKTKRQYLQLLVSEKNKWHRPLTDGEKSLGFLGWHQRDYLPHCDFPDLIQLVTFRLADSMPASRRGEWEHLLKIENIRTKRMKLEEYLDRGIGKCWLRRAEMARLLERSLMCFHNDRYELLAWCIMPNHAHVLLHIWRTPLSKIVQSWKRFVAVEGTKILMERRSPSRRVCDDDAFVVPSQRPAFQWQREYWDTFMRNEAQQRKAVLYIENNPVKSHLCREAADWPFSSARFRDPFHRLQISKEVAYV